MKKFMGWFGNKWEWVKYNYKLLLLRAPILLLLLLLLKSAVFTNEFKDEANQLVLEIEVFLLSIKNSILDVIKKGVQLNVLSKVLILFITIFIVATIIKHRDVQRLFFSKFDPRIFYQAKRGLIIFLLYIGSPVLYIQLIRSVIDMFKIDSFSVENINSMQLLLFMANTFLLMIYIVAITVYSFFKKTTYQIKIEELKNRNQHIILNNHAKLAIHILWYSFLKYFSIGFIVILTDYCSDSISNSILIIISVLLLLINISFDCILLYKCNCYRKGLHLGIIRKKESMNKTLDIMRDWSYQYYLDDFKGILNSNMILPFGGKYIKDKDKLNKMVKQSSIIKLNFDSIGDDYAIESLNYHMRLKNSKKDGKSRVCYLLLPNINTNRSARCRLHFRITPKERNRIEYNFEIYLRYRKKHGVLVIDQEIIKLLPPIQQKKKQNKEEIMYSESEFLWLGERLYLGKQNELNGRNSLSEKLELKKESYDDQRNCILINQPFGTGKSITTIYKLSEIRKGIAVVNLNEEVNDSDYLSKIYENVKRSLLASSFISSRFSLLWRIIKALKKNIFVLLYTFSLFGALYLTTYNILKTRYFRPIREFILYLLGDRISPEILKISLILFLFIISIYFVPEIIKLLHKNTNSYENFFLSIISGILINKNIVLVLENMDRLEITGIRDVSSLISGLNFKLNEQNCKQCCVIVSIDKKRMNQFYGKIEKENFGVNKESNTCLAAIRSRVKKQVFNDELNFWVEKCFYREISYHNNIVKEYIKELNGYVKELNKIIIMEKNKSSTFKGIYIKRKDVSLREVHREYREQIIASLNQREDKN